MKPAAATKESEDLDAGMPGLSSGRILIVDDE